MRSASCHPFDTAMVWASLCRSDRFMVSLWVARSRYSGALAYHPAPPVQPCEDGTHTRYATPSWLFRAWPIQPEGGDSSGAASSRSTAFSLVPAATAGTAKGNPLAVIVVTPGWTWGRHRLGPALSLANAAGGLLRSCPPWSALVVWISAAGFHGRKKDPATVGAGSILSLLPVRRWHQAGWEGSPLIAVLYSPGM